VFIVLILLSGFVVNQSKPCCQAGEEGCKIRLESVAKKLKVFCPNPSVGVPDNRLKLIGVDEKTAAIIMAIVCHESDALLMSWPLSGLRPRIDVQEECKMR
jgi:hypothetical protein